jgi:hypothetical protein
VKAPDGSIPHSSGPLVIALCRARDPLHGLDANDGRDDRVLEAVIGFAEVFLHGLGIEATSDLLGGCDCELAAGDLDEAPALKFVLEQLAVGLCAFQKGVGMAERVGKCWVSKVVEAGWGYDRDVGSLGHGLLRWLGLEPGTVLQAPSRLAIFVMGHPPGRIQSAPFQMRASPEFLKSVDKWRAKQEDKPSRAEAIRRLVEIGLTVTPKTRPTERARVRAAELAVKAIDKIGDPTAHPEEHAQRRRRLTKGPEEFREVRVDRPKAKGK